MSLDDSGLKYEDCDGLKMGGLCIMCVFSIFDSTKESQNDPGLFITKIKSL